MNIDRDSRISLSDIKYVSPRAGEARVVQGDVLFNNTNSPELVGKAAVVEEDADWAFSNHMTRLRPSEGLDPHFIVYQFRLLREVGYFRERAKQYVNQATVTLNVLRDIPLIIAPPEEQIRIVQEINQALAVAETVDVTCSELLTKLDRFRSSVLRRAVTGKLLPLENGSTETGVDLLLKLVQREGGREKRNQFAGVEPSSSQSQPNGQPEKTSPLLKSDALPDLPEHWAWARVHEVGQVTLGRQRSPKHHHGPNMRAYLRVANIYEDRIDTTDVHMMNFTPEEFEVYRLITGDILLNEGQSPELVGRPAMFRNELPEVAFQKTLIRFRAHPGMSPGFSLLVFRHYFRSGRFTAVARASTNIAHLGAARFADLEFPVPPLWEQERIVAEAHNLLSTADDVSERIRAVLDWAQRWRLLMLRTAFRGELTAQSTSDTPARTVINNLRATPSPKHRAKHRPMSEGESMPKHRTERRPLHKVLEMHGGVLTPEELLRESGIGEDLVEDFFEELKRERIAGRIDQHLDPTGDTVYLHLTNVP
jgi:type I restriction enzyme S subunit